MVAFMRYGSARVNFRQAHAVEQQRAEGEPVIGCAAFGDVRKKGRYGFAGSSATAPLPICFKVLLMTSKLVASGSTLSAVT